MIDQKMNFDKDSGASPAFFMGPPGLYTLAALIYSHIDDQSGSNVDKYLGFVLNAKLLYGDKNKNRDKLEEEILYGSAGYLYCLLTLRKNLGLRHQPDIDKVI